MNYTEFQQVMNTEYFRANCYHTMQYPDQDATSGNHHVINGTYYLISEKLGGYTNSINQTHDALIANEFFKSTQHLSGVFNRHPSKATDQETQDDYFGIEVTSLVLDLPLTPKAILEHGRNSFFYYDNLSSSSPKLGEWFGRFPGLKAVFTKGAGEQPNVVNQLGFCMSILYSLVLPKSTTDVSSRILQWLQNRVMKGTSPMVDYCIKLWEDRIKRDYPTGQMGEVLGIYHGPLHPFARAMAGKL